MTDPLDKILDCIEKAQPFAVIHPNVLKSVELEKKTRNKIYRFAIRHGVNPEDFYFLYLTEILRWRQGEDTLFVLASFLKTLKENQNANHYRN